VSGRGRTQPDQGGNARRSRPARPGDGFRTGDTQPVPRVRSHYPPSTGSSRAARWERAERRKRNQRLGVVLGAVALGGAAIGGVIAGMAGGDEPAATSSSSPSATTSVTPMAITCPTDGGASPIFGHDIVVPEPYTVTITYGDGDEYTDDSAHLDAIFSHTYANPGTYTVNAVLTSPAAGTASATCDYTWGP
jgi:hypothetical protein